ncbi:MAG: bifunctional hydroxymethylpyrimidine kinase/phosphomethylpyrimidine kinase [Bacilli bacterium]
MTQKNIINDFCSLCKNSLNNFDKNIEEYKVNAYIKQEHIRLMHFKKICNYIVLKYKNEDTIIFKDIINYKKKLNEDLDDITHITKDYICMIDNLLITLDYDEIILLFVPYIISKNELIKNLSLESDYGEYYGELKDFFSDMFVDKYIKYASGFTNDFFKLSLIFKKGFDCEKLFCSQLSTDSKNVVLTIAGSDSSGGAGISADIKTISANGGYAASVITAVTAQNTTGVYAVVELDSDIISKQIECVLNDLDVKAIKIGMLSCARIIETVAKSLKSTSKIVLDPVMVAKDNSVLLSENSIDSLVNTLFPLCYLITPNIEEVSQILNYDVDSELKMEDACLELYQLGAKNVLIKGGHLKGEVLVDVLYYEGKFYKYYSKRVDTVHTHGTGCSLSSAIATNLANGMDLNVAVKNATKYIYDGIVDNYVVGSGKSPINHFHSKIKI